MPNTEIWIYWVLEKLVSSHSNEFPEFYLHSDIEFIMSVTPANKGLTKPTEPCILGKFQENRTPFIMCVDLFEKFTESSRIHGYLFMFHNPLLKW